MELLYNVALWILFWPLKLPVWLWKHETIGKVFALLWTVCWLLIGVSFLPRQAEKTELSRTAQAWWRSAEQPSAGLTLSKASLIEAALVVSPSTSSISMVTQTFPSKSAAATVAPTEPPVFTDTPILIITSTPWPLLTSTSTQTPLPTQPQQPTLSPTLPPTMTASPTPAAKLAAAPTALAPVATGEALVIQPTATPADQTASNPSGFTCAGGCNEAPDLSCAIKGNVNAKGDKIYHMPGGKNYDLTRIKPAEGDRWFCTEQEAQDAGFRVAKSY